MNRGEEILFIDKNIFVTEFKDFCVLFFAMLQSILKNWDTFLKKYGLFFKFLEIFYFLQPASFCCSVLAAVWSVVSLGWQLQKTKSKRHQANLG